MDVGNHAAYVAQRLGLAAIDRPLALLHIPATAGSPRHWPEHTHSLQHTHQLVSHHEQHHHVLYKPD